MDFVEILGYIATAFVAGSFLLKDILKLRIVNTIGCILFVIYGVLIHSYPVIGLNAFLTVVNTYYVISLMKNGKKS